MAGERIVHGRVPVTSGDKHEQGTATAHEVTQPRAGHFQYRFDHVTARFLLG
jgi:hypothetical protein